MPSGVQEYVYQQMQSVEDKTDVAKLKSFGDAKEIAQRFAARRAEAHGPIPMDVGNMQHQQPYQQQENDWQEENGDAYRYPWQQLDYPQATPWGE